RHGIGRELRSGWFWLASLGFPLVMLGFMAVMAVVGASAEVEEPAPEVLLTVVPGDLALREAVEAWTHEWGTEVGAVRLVLADGGSPTHPVLYLAGSPSRPYARVVVRSAAEAERLRDVADRVTWGLMRQAVLQEGEAERAADASSDPAPASDGGDTDDDAEGEAVETDVATRIAHDLEVLARSAGTLVAGLGALLGVLHGLAAGQHLSQDREKGLFGVLRVGTPPAVLYVGGLLERLVLGVASALPFLVVLLPPLGLALLGAGMIRPDLLLWIALGLPTFALLASTGGFTLAAMIGAVVGSAQRGQRGAALSSLITPVVAVAGIPLFQLARNAEGLAAVALLGVPVVGVAPLIDGLQSGTSW
ncbi:MAG: hypothetical protein KC656_34990, partial [Myxococcales bacterium]|nr:hypothetical protein [Myxococcales bacterium]